MKKLILIFLLIPSLCFATEPIDWSKTYAIGPAILGGAGGAKAASGDNCTGSETMGWTDVEDTNHTLGTSSAVVFGTFTAPCTGTLTAGYVYLDGDGGTAGGKLAVFEDLSGSTGSCGATDGAPNDTCDAVVAVSGIIAGDTADAWYHNTFASGSVTKGHKYWLVFYNDNVGGVRLRRGADSGSAFTDYDSSCDGYQNAIGEITYAGGCTFPTDDGYEFSMYVTLGAP